MADKVRRVWVGVRLVAEGLVRGWASVMVLARFACHPQQLVVGLGEFIRMQGLELKSDTFAAGQG
jgi:hypothetical protein